MQSKKVKNMRIADVENKATEELLKIDGFREAFTEAIEQIESGETVSLTSIRRDV